MTTRSRARLRSVSSLEPERSTGARDPAMDEFADAVELETWESETDVVSVESFRALLKRATDWGPLRAFRRPERDSGGRAGASVDYVERDIDVFGCDQDFLERIFPLGRWVHDRYFRVESRGVENIPSEGRVLLVANHSGTLPYDGAMVVAAVRIRHSAQRLVRPLVEDFVYHFPYLGMFMARVGAVRACQENAARLLDEDAAVLVFPEGVKGIGKLYRQRYQLQRFGRGGAIRLAMRAGAPIIPVSIVGAEESMPLLSKLGWLARPLGLPYLPITPTLPWAGPLGLLPFPTKWYIDFGEPIDLSSYGTEGLSDRVLVNRLNEQVRGAVQSMVDTRLSERSTVFGG